MVTRAIRGISAASDFRHRCALSVSLTTSCLRPEQMFCDALFITEPPNGQPRGAPARRVRATDRFWRRENVSSTSGETGDDLEARRRLDSARSRVSRPNARRASKSLPSAQFVGVDHLHVFNAGKLKDVLLATVQLVHSCNNAAQPIAN
jgi:hypothetical protein